jgi:hypothetical protein
MAHPLGAALTVPFATRRRLTGGGPNWPIRVLRTAAMVAVGSDASGWPVRARHRTLAHPAVPGRPRASARTAGE